ncbi:MAG: hypothetical protein II937_00545 [Bacteroidales bacterium]|nr:hypothetical protein [Bacteroidales bacterium]
MKTTSILCIILALLLSASCHKDDDKKSSSPDQTSVDESSIEAQKIFAASSILQNLAGLRIFNDESLTKTYESVYGILAEDGSEMVRTKIFSTVDEAEEDFLLIVGQSALLTTTSDGYTVSIQDLPLKDGKTIQFGTLTFHRGDGGRLLGYVEVDIPCLPHLERIEYKTADAIGTNGSSSAYLLGDIVFVSSNYGYCPGFYLCVRQCNEGEGVLVHLGINEPGGDESINLDGDNEGCWYPYNNDKGHTATLSDIRSYAAFMLNNPRAMQVAKDFLDGKFTDVPPLSGRKSDLFPEGFCNDRGVVWHSSDSRAAAIRFNATWEEISYYWWDWRVSHYFVVPQDCTNPGSISQNSFRYIEDDTWDEHCNKMWNYTINVIHFYGDQKISGVTTVLNAKTATVVTKEDAERAEKEQYREENAAENVTKKQLGWCYASNNVLYKTAADAIADNTTPLGMVVYVSDGSDEGSDITEGYGHGLVMAYNNCSSVTQKRWVFNAEEPITASTRVNDKCDGLYETESLASQHFAAAEDALNYTPKAPKGTSSWFIPSAGQWLAILLSPGIGNVQNRGAFGIPFDLRDKQNNAYNIINNALQRSAPEGYSPFALTDSYWTSSTFNIKGNDGVVLTQKNTTTYLELREKQTTAYVRPVFAF